MAFGLLGLGVAAFAAVGSLDARPIDGGFQSSRQSAALTSGISSPHVSGTNSPRSARQAAHDKNWLKKAAEKRYNGTLTSPKKAEKPPKVEEKPAERD